MTKPNKRPHLTEGEYHVCSGNSTKLHKPALQLAVTVASCMHRAAVICGLVGSWASGLASLTLTADFPFSYEMNLRQSNVSVLHSPLFLGL